MMMFKVIVHAIFFGEFFFELGIVSFFENVPPLLLWQWSKLKPRGWVNNWYFSAWLI
jgi:hypothetical protein